MHWSAWIWSALHVGCLGTAHSSGPGTSYLAPHTSAGSKAHQDVFIVKYRKTHTLEAHFEFLGTNLTEVTNDFVHHDNFGTYTIKCSSSLLHDLIRTDPGIEWTAEDSMHDYTEFLVKSDMRSHMPDIGTIRWLDHANEINDDPSGNMTKRWGSNVPVAPASSWMQQLTSAYKVEAGRGPYRGMDLAGLGVNLYVLDSGINAAHTDFRNMSSNSGSRVSNFRGETSTHYTTPQGLDPNKNLNPDQRIRCHGTLLASLAAGADYGLAKGANIINLRLWNDDNVNQISDSINAFHAIVADHKSNMASSDATFRGSLILYAAGKVDDAHDGLTLYQAFAGARDAGIPVIVAAGNAGCDVADNCGLNAATIPCAFSDTNEYGDALGNIWCIGSLDLNYAQSSFSNYGNAVQGWTPGDVPSGASCDDTTSYYEQGGTSQASAMAAGLMATFQSYLGPTANHLDLNIIMAENGIPNGLVFPTDKTPVNPLVLTNGANSGLRYKGPFAWAPNVPVMWNGDFPDYWID